MSTFWWGMPPTSEGSCGTPRSRTSSSRVRGTTPSESGIPGNDIIFLPLLLPFFFLYLSLFFPHSNFYISHFPAYIFPSSIILPLFFLYLCPHPSPHFSYLSFSCISFFRLLFYLYSSSISVLIPHPNFHISYKNCEKKKKNF